jgi:hypothetical protein
MLVRLSSRRIVERDDMVVKVGLWAQPAVNVMITASVA